MGSSPYGTRPSGGPRHGPCSPPEPSGQADQLGGLVTVPNTGHDPSVSALSGQVLPE